MPLEKSPQTIAAEFQSVLGIYQDKRKQGQRHDQAFLAAVSAYRHCHPKVPRPAAAHEVSRMIRSIGSTTTN